MTDDTHYLIRLARAYTAGVITRWEFLWRVFRALYLGR